MSKNIELTTFEKKIYNQWLITSRVKQGKPFKLRENFDNIKPETARALGIIARRLSSKFINLRVYFEAPYHMIKDTDYFPLEYYTGMKGIAQYKSYFDKFVIENPDDESSLRFLKESISFIDKFCKDKDIEINDYINYSFGATPAWLNHLKERKISFFILFSFKNFQGSYNKLAILRQDMLSREYNSLDKLRAKYLSSPKTRKNITLFKNYVEKKGN